MLSLKSDKYRYRVNSKSDTFREINQMKRTESKTEAKKNKSDNFTKIIREKSNFAIVIFAERIKVYTTIIISHFEGTNNMFTDCIMMSIIQFNICLKIYLKTTNQPFFDW